MELTSIIFSSIYWSVIIVAISVYIYSFSNKIYKSIRNHRKITASTKNAIAWLILLFSFLVFIILWGLERIGLIEIDFSTLVTFLFAGLVTSLLVCQHSKPKAKQKKKEKKANKSG